jgi:beta-RFAP synthase
MIRVTAPSRLHFGLLSLPAPESHAPRHFGSVGLMVSQPGLALRIEPAEEWSAAGPLAERALAFGRRFADSFPPGAVGPHHLVIEHAPPEHTGLGTGTQLALAVARALAGSCGLDGLDAVALARRVGRGRRSALGIHGFARGGFLVEAGKRTEEAISPLVARADIPEPWRIVLVLPPWGPGLHGADEGRAFEQLGAGPAGPARTERLCRLVLLDMLPALAEHDLDTFGEAVYELNRRVGEMFRRVQGGTYAHPRVQELVEFVRRQGVAGVGQSSWGPGVFALTADLDWAVHLTGQIRRQFALQADEALVTTACNRGATVGAE